jgi:hypothetical protein
MLKYLNVRNIAKHYFEMKHNKRIGSHGTGRLKQLILMDFSVGFEEFEMLAKQTPNLKSLIISSF